MRLLSVGNLYPPHTLGGYELVWQSANRHLRSSGHQVRVLTTDTRLPGAPGEEEDSDVHRELRWYWRDYQFPRLKGADRFRLERANTRCFDRHLAIFRPEAVAWWSMGGMSLSLVGRARGAGLPAVGFVHDDWMLYGPQVDQWTRMLSRRPWLARSVEGLTGIPGRFRPAGAARWLFNSRTMRHRAEASVGELPGAGVLEPGVQPAFLRAAGPRPWQGRLLYVGRLDERKGVETALDAVAHLGSSTSLRVVGRGEERYEAALRARVRDQGLKQRVSFDGARGRSELPDIYAACDALVFPVRWEEPWGLAPLEAMGMGRPVVATGRGGSGEYLEDDGNCLLFEAGDSRALAAAVDRLAADEALRRRLREGGRTTASRYSEASFNQGVVEALERAARGM